MVGIVTSHLRCVNFYVFHFLVFQPSHRRMEKIPSLHPLNSKK